MDLVTVSRHQQTAAIFAFCLKELISLSLMSKRQYLYSLVQIPFPVTGSKLLKKEKELLLTQSIEITLFQVSAKYREKKRIYTTGRLLKTRAVLSSSYTNDNSHKRIFVTGWPK
jgi:hypothetical protein